MKIHFLIIGIAIALLAILGGIWLCSHQKTVPDHDGSVVHSDVSEPSQTPKSIKTPDVSTPPKPVELEHLQTTKPPTAKPNVFEHPNTNSGTQPSVVSDKPTGNENEDKKMKFRADYKRLVGRDFDVDIEKINQDEFDNGKLSREERVKRATIRFLWLSNLTGKATIKTRQIDKHLFFALPDKEYQSNEKRNAEKIHFFPSRDYKTGELSVQCTNYDPQKTWIGVDGVASDFYLARKFQENNLDFRKNHSRLFVFLNDFYGIEVRQDNYAIFRRQKPNTQWDKEEWLIRVKRYHIPGEDPNDDENRIDYFQHVMAKESTGEIEVWELQWDPLPFDANGKKLIRSGKL